MKKLFPIALVAVVAMTFTSCKKEYTCECTITSNGVPQVSGSYKITETKSKAESACTAMQSTVTSGTTTVTSACTLK